ncbi:MAG TPA: hypothetical protein VLB29_05540 [Nocardioidaceae bacterium]|nr:hypothetical protein [Nocardioidaceae bacterium]
MSVRRALRAVIPTVVLTLALAGLPLAPAGALLPIEGYPNYQPQTNCSPHAKPGTLKLANHLLKRYPGSRSMGISRACSASGVSEHKEGRAFDWSLSARSKRDRGYARHFIQRLRATDRAGHRNALARRMGIMYVIWNDRIWSASKNYRERDYVHSACSRRKLRRCSVTLRHRDHMHISLTRAAARGLTSWYVAPGKSKKVSKPKRAQKPKPKVTEKKSEPKTKAVPKQKPEPKKSPEAKPEPEPKQATRPHRAPRGRDGIIDLRRVAYTRVAVPANGETVETRFKLRKGTTYSLTAAGLYTFGEPTEVGDAVCTWSSKEQTWVPKPNRRTRRAYGRLALVVNGRRPFGEDCRGSHTYRTQLTPTRDRTIKLRVAGGHAAARGRLTVVVGRKQAKVRGALPEYPTLNPAPTYSAQPRKGHGLIAEEVTLTGSTSGATYTRRGVEPGATYRLTVSGRVKLGGGVVSDGQCVSVRGTWYEAASLDPRVPGADHGNLYVNGVPFEGTSESGCGGTRVAEIVADSRGRLRLDLWDPVDASDNTGELTVLAQRVTAITTPTPANRERPRPRREEWKQRRDDLAVDARRASGTVSTMRLRKGERVRVVVSGRFRSGRRLADASCQRIKREWLTYDDQVLGQDPFNLWVDGQQVTWRALGSGRGCSEENRYTARFTATKNGPLRLGVFDLDHAENRGKLEVILRRLKG